MAVSSWLDKQIVCSDSVVILINKREWTTDTQKNIGEFQKKKNLAQRKNQVPEEAVRHDPLVNELQKQTK